MSIEQQPDRCSLTRRELLRRSGMGLGMLGLAGVLADGGRAAAPRPASREDGYQNPLAERPPHFPAKAKRVIHLFMNGGPSHVDTFDPKPSLDKYAGKTLPTPNLRDRAQDRRGASLRRSSSRSTARAASRSASCSRTRPSTSTTSPSSARCTPTCPTTSRRCC